MKPELFYQEVYKHKIIAIVRGVAKEKIELLAEALFKGGIKLLEITCNTDGFERQIEIVSEAFGSNILVGAGTVTSVELAKKAISAGAEYLIAPDVNPDVIQYCTNKNVPIIPGALTPTEVLTAIRHGASMIKVFPVAAMGPGYVKQLCGPINDVGFITVGGVDENNMGEYFAAGCVGAGLGGCLIKKDLVESGAWSELTALAERIVSIAKQ